MAYPCCALKWAVSECCCFSGSSQQLFVIVLLLKETKISSLKALCQFYCRENFSCFWTADLSSVPSIRSHPISVHGGNFHWFCGSWVWDLDFFVPACVWTVLCLLEIILQAQLTSVFISPLFSLLSKKIYCMTAIISYPRLKPCE